MAGQLRANVHVKTKGGDFKVFKPGDDLPAWAEKIVPEHAFVSAQEEQAGPPVPVTDPPVEPDLIGEGGN